MPSYINYGLRGLQLDKILYKISILSKTSRFVVVFQDFYSIYKHIYLLKKLLMRIDLKTIIKPSQVVSLFLVPSHINFLATYYFGYYWYCACVILFNAHYKARGVCLQIS